LFGLVLACLPLNYLQDEILVLANEMFNASLRVIVLITGTVLAGLLQSSLLQTLVSCHPAVGREMTPYYKQILTTMNGIASKKSRNISDRIDYKQSTSEDIAAEVLRTLEIMEKVGSSDAFTIIKHLVPTYESCLSG
jgi:hypothetical protein